MDRDDIIKLFPIGTTVRVKDTDSVPSMCRGLVGVVMRHAWSDSWPIKVRPLYEAPFTTSGRAFTADELEVVS